MTTRNKLLIMLALLLLLLIPSTGTLAKKEPFYVNGKALSSIISLGEGDRDADVVLRLEKIACSKGLVNDFIESVDQVIYIDGVPIEKAFQNESDYWSTPTEYFDLDSCLWDVENTWISYWEYPIGKLKPGEYTISVQQWLNSPVIDGLDFRAPFGEIDVLQGVQISNEFILTIIAP